MIFAYFTFVTLSLIFLRWGKLNELNISTFNEEDLWLFSALNNISSVHRDDKEL